MGVRRLTVAVAALALLVVACGGDDDGAVQSAQEPGPAPASVTIGIRTDIDTFDAATTQGDLGASQMLRLAYATLVWRTLDGEIVPQLAEEWEVTPTSGVFTIRDDVTCPGGEPLTPSDIAASFQRLADPETGSTYASRIFGGAGAKSVTADDDAGTVTIELDAPNTDMLAGLANAGQVVCPAGVADPDSLSEGPNGPGPYQMVDAQRGSSYVFERRDDFVGLPPGTEISDLPERVTLQVVDEDTTMANLLLAEDITIGNILGRDADRLRADDRLTDVSGAAYGVDGLLFNHAEGLPGADPAFRLAVARGIDPEGYARAATFGFGEPMRTLYTPNLECYSEDAASSTPDYDADAANAALDEAGYAVVGGVRTMPDGSPLTLRVVGYAGQNQGPEFIADALEQLQFDIDLTSGSYEEALGPIFGGEFDAFVFPFTSSFASEALYFNQVSVGAALNVSGIDNADYESAAAEARATEGEARCTHWQEAERGLLTQADTVPLVQPMGQYFGNGVTFEATYYYVDPYTIRSA